MGDRALARFSAETAKKATNFPKIAKLMFWLF
jgi:hypothetical protein